MTKLKKVDCQDSTSALTTEKRHFTKGNSTEFSIDLAIVAENSDGTWYRLIHKKTGYVSNDQWYWNEGPHSKGLSNRVNWCKNYPLETPASILSFLPYYSYCNTLTLPLLLFRFRLTPRYYIY